MDDLGEGRMKRKKLVHEKRFVNTFLSLPSLLSSTFRLWMMEWVRAVREGKREREKKTLGGRYPGR